jgi:hypothetical protein
MLSIRMIFAGAVTALVVAATANGAMAQSGAPVPGRPLSLLAGLLPPHDTKAAAHAKTAHRTARKTVATRTVEHRVAKAKLASKRHHDVAAAEAATPPVQTEPAALPDNAWPAPAPVPPADVAATPAPQTAPANADMQPSEVVVEGQTVQIASPDQVNALDLAADNHTDAAAMPADRADAAAHTQTVLAAPVHVEASPVGSPSWIAQVLAALGGAVAAGSVAWFLIGSGPVRTYG